MQIVDGYTALAPTDARPSAVGIGVFDGLHLGHQALLKQVVSLARAEGLRAVAYTFAPHPARLFAPERAPQLIEPIYVRLERLAALGFDCAVVQAFDKAFASHTAQGFVTDILERALCARHVVVGAGFAFGHKQQGNVAVLRALGPAAGFLTHPVAHVKAGGVEVSSTKVRGFIRAGNAAQAAVFLGRPFMLLGGVVQGAHRGTQIGIPTANLAADNELRPQAGVYAGAAEGTFGREPCVVNIGTNPTFESGDAVKIEAHLFDYKGPAFYDTSMRLHLHAYIRGERRFDGVAALKAQIQQDIHIAKRGVGDIASSF